MDFDEILSKQRSTLQDILDAATVPGLSLGVLHHGQVVHEAHFGYQDVAAEKPPNADTQVNINSLTKAIVVAAVAALIDDGKVKWDTKVKEFFTEFDAGQPEKMTTIADLLSHRSGRQTPNTLWIQDHNEILLAKDDAVPVFLHYADGAYDNFRSSCMYNNYGYSIVGLLIEAISEQHLGDFLHDRVFGPLGMTRTTTEQLEANGNTAKSYAVLSDRSFYEISLVQWLGRDTMAEGAGGVKSTLSDLLKFYGQFLKLLLLPEEDNLLPKSFRDCIKPQAFFDTSGLREESYALGLVRAELPTQLGKLGPNPTLVELPTLGEGAPSVLDIYHQGLQPGSSTAVHTFPEADLVIVTLQNSSSTCDCADWVAQHCIQTIFQYPKPVNYVDLASQSSKHYLEAMPSINRELEEKRETGTEPSRSLSDFTGRYWDGTQRFFLEVSASGSTDTQSDAGSLLLRFQGRPSQSHRLVHYHRDVFSWAMTHDEASRKGRHVNMYNANFYLLQFKVDKEKGVVGLHWQLETATPENTVYFAKE